jgi:hypothetical protein
MQDKRLDIVFNYQLARKDFAHGTPKITARQ